MNNTPRVEWREIEGGDLVAHADGVDLSVSQTGIKWQWMLYWKCEQFGWFGYYSLCQTRDLAKAECEYALSRELKARAWDEMQREKK